MARFNTPAHCGAPDILYGQTPEHARTIFEFNPRDRPELGNGQPLRGAGWTSSQGVSLQQFNGRFGMAPNADVPAAAANVVGITSPGFYVPPGTIYDVTLELGRMGGDALVRVAGTGVQRVPNSPFYELVDLSTTPIVTVKMRTNIYVMSGNNIQLSSHAAGSIRPIIYSLTISRAYTNIPG